MLETGSLLAVDIAGFGVSLHSIELLLAEVAATRGMESALRDLKGSTWTLLGKIKLYGWDDSS